MILSGIPSDQIVLIDANIILYANQKASAQSVELLERCANHDVIGVLPMHTLAEVMHVLMLAEARDLGIITSGNPAKQLSEKPNLVKSMSRYEFLIWDLLTIGLQIEPVQREDIIQAMSIQRQYGLLTNDAIFLAVGTRLRVNAIASADHAFGNIQGVVLYSPNDIK